MNEESRAKVERIEAEINEMFAVYASLYDGVRDLVVEILDKVKGRSEGDYDDRDLELLGIARKLTDMVLAVAEKIEKSKSD